MQGYNLGRGALVFVIHWCQRLPTCSSSCLASSINPWCDLLSWSTLTGLPQGYFRSFGTPLRTQDTFHFLLLYSVVSEDLGGCLEPLLFHAVPAGMGDHPTALHSMSGSWEPLVNIQTPMPCCLHPDEKLRDLASSQAWPREWWLKSPICLNLNTLVGILWCFPTPRARPWEVAISGLASGMLTSIWFFCFPSGSSLPFC